MEHKSTSNYPPTSTPNHPTGGDHKKSSSSKKHHSNKPPKKSGEIVIIDEGPCYICENCHAFLRVPEKEIREDSFKEKDEDGKDFTVTEFYFMCPKCREKSIIDEESDSEDEKH